MRERPQRLANRLDYRFDDPARLEQALTHRSAGSPNNERLEFLGDAILGFVIADELCARFPDADEGRLSRLRARLVRKTSLAELARELEMGSYLLLGAGELRSGGQSRDSTLADALEAVFGAVYLDGGHRPADDLIRRLFRQRLDGLKLGQAEKDPKTRLQEYLQAEGRGLPEYAVLEVTGDPHAQEFQVACRVPGLAGESRGRGTSRRRAEQAAAKLMLRELQP